MNPFDSNLKRFQTAYAQFFELTEHYPAHLVDVPGACGEWSPRQVVAHLSGWVIEGQRRFNEVLAGDVIPSMRYDVDTFNAEQVAARAHLDWNATLIELQSVVSDLDAQAQAIAVDRRTTDSFFAGWLKALAHDVEQHIIQLRQFAEPAT